MSWKFFILGFYLFFAVRTLKPLWCFARCLNRCYDCGPVALPDRHGLKSHKTVNRLQEALIQALQEEIATNHPTENGLFPRLLMVISSLRELSVEHRCMLGTIKGKPEFLADAEAFNLAE